ncbi:hypothetical protein [Chitinivibrio alkaliphilus]|uniref:Vpu protein n=1 Tax=Chitinivibrio alkaliphilus ACht1 TaxID=1313304 RepID=U7D6L4_9BACT|nr:hypothetical protein [Chitinivibrio alkaliphilus]ERP31211.1 hypothetical protein CALK_1924 [Chitinivibrio alkaliphilus ACht1]
MAETIQWLWILVLFFFGLILFFIWAKLLISARCVHRINQYLERIDEVKDMSDGIGDIEL